MSNGKGSGRRPEDRERVAANWARIDWSSTPQTEREITPPEFVRDVLRVELEPWQQGVLSRLAAGEVVECPKCKATSGNDWSQCKGSCPMPMSPHFTP